MVSASGDEVLGRAVRTLETALEAVRVARRELTLAVVGAYRAGVPVARIAERCGLHPVAVRNLLDAAGEPRTRR
uniref:hypothetical protein n=1 Tax=Kitasatospora indigofera TaxID=67307 RepID=UPI002F918BDA